MTPTLPAATSAPARTVPFADVTAGNDEVRAALDSVWHSVVGTSRFVGGPLVERFENEWADYCGVAHAVGVANGTDALHLALRALGIGPGDEVVVPTNTFVATAEAVALAGARPVFIDVDATTLLMTPETVEAAITPATAAVVAVHLYGHMPDMDGLLAVTRRHGIALVEDAAQAHGSTWNGRRAGSFGAAGCFSFYPGKNLGALGDGGAVVTNDAAVAQRIRAMADHGRDEDGYHHVIAGTNSRLDALQAGALSAKLPRLEDWNARRRVIVDAYREQFAPYGPGFLVEPMPDVVSSWHLLIAQVPQRDNVRTALRAAGIDARIHYPTPCHLTPAFAHLSPGPLSVAEATAHTILSLPLWPQMTTADVSTVASAVRRSVGDLAAQ